LLAIVLLVLVAGIAASAVFFGLSFPHSGQLLTITKPTGGSISASGIRCGSRGRNETTVAVLVIIICSVGVCDG